MGAPLQELEARYALRVEGDDLTVQDHLALDLRQRPGDLRETGREIELVAAPEREVAAHEAGQGPEAVVLQLVEPVLPVGRRPVGERGQHGREDAAEELLRGAAHDGVATTRTSSKPS